MRNNMEHQIKELQDKLARQDYDMQELIVQRKRQLQQIEYLLSIIDDCDDCSCELDRDWRDQINYEDTYGE